jgi:hypothetical protein
MRLQHLPKLGAFLFSLCLLAALIVPAQAATTTEAKPNQVFLPLIASGGVTAPAPQPSAFEALVASVTNGQADVVTGAYVADVLALAVTQQPVNDPAYVSSAPDVATQFQMAEIFGVTGLLAHNSAAGANFFGLAVGQEAQIIYGDGTVQRYHISRIERFQALDPDNPSTDFVDLQTGATLSAADVFNQVYTDAGNLVFQTCIANNGNASWGRLFVVAEPVN